MLKLVEKLHALRPRDSDHIEEYLRALLVMAANLITEGACCEPHSWSGLAACEQFLREVFAEMLVKRFPERQR